MCGVSVYDVRVYGVHVRGVSAYSMRVNGDSVHNVSVYGASAYCGGGRAVCNVIMLVCVHTILVHVSVSMVLVLLKLLLDHFPHSSLLPSIHMSAVSMLLLLLLHHLPRVKPDVDESPHKERGKTRETLIKFSV